MGRLLLWVRLEGTILLTIVTLSRAIWLVGVAWPLLLSCTVERPGCTGVVLLLVRLLGLVVLLRWWRLLIIAVIWLLRGLLLLMVYAALLGRLLL